MAEVDALQQALAQLQEELTTYQAALHQQLARLQQEASAERQKLTSARPAAAAMAVNLAAKARDTAQGIAPKPPPAPAESAPPSKEPGPGVPAFLPPTLPPPTRAREAAQATFLLPPVKARETAQASSPLPPVKTRDTAQGMTEPLPEPEPPPSSPSPPLRSRETVHGSGQEFRGGKPVSVLISNGLADSEPISGWVLDRWQTGMKILVDEEIQVGLVLSVRPNKNEPGVQWLQISVKSCTPERNSFLLNCHFLHRPPWNVLAMFAG